MQVHRSLAPSLMQAAWLWLHVSYACADTGEAARGSERERPDRSVCAESLYSPELAARSRACAWEFKRERERGRERARESARERARARERERERERELLLGAFATYCTRITSHSCLLAARSQPPESYVCVCVFVGCDR